MEPIMKTNRYFPLILIAAAVVSGCSSMAPTAALTDAHNSYNRALASQEVTSLAAIELKQASETLNKADAALKECECEDKVDQLAYIAKQQVAIAQETARQKNAELTVTNATAERDKIRLEARTAEADAAKRQLEELNAQKNERGLTLTLGDVLFRTGKARLEPGGMRSVEKLADFLNQHQDYSVMIEGHTDNVGSRDNNQDLSERRADAVQTALIDMNIDSARISTRGYADAFPIASNSTAAGRQMNRRVEIIISNDKGGIAPR
jgi:outer membrane protein OmpA-like peptidoglycan-associated protein